MKGHRKGQTRERERERERERGCSQEDDERFPLMLFSKVGF
jgi:hypothetical protein